MISKIAQKVILKLAREHEYHSTQINLPKEDFLKLQSIIPEDSVYKEGDKYSRDLVPHITLLYGLKDEKDFPKIREMLAGFNSFSVKIGNISAFRTSDKPYDVLKLDVISSLLKYLHKTIKKNFDNDYEFPEYHPHITLAYIKKDTCKELEGHCDITGSIYDVYNVIFSHKDDYFLDMPLSPKKDVDFCPVCKEEYNTICKCKLGEKTCPKGHSWLTCPVHKDKIVVLNNNIHPEHGVCLCGDKNMELKEKIRGILGQAVVKKDVFGVMGEFYNTLTNLEKKLDTDLTNVARVETNPALKGLITKLQRDMSTQIGELQSFMTKYNNVLIRTKTKQMKPQTQI